MYEPVGKMPIIKNKQRVKKNIIFENLLKLKKLKITPKINKNKIKLKGLNKYHKNFDKKKVINLLTIIRLFD